MSQETKLQKFFGFKGLSDESVNKSLLSAGQRAFRALPLHIALFWFTVLREASLRSNPTIVAMTMAYLLGMGIQFYLWKNGARILATEGGRKTYRTWSWIGTLIISLVWGVTCSVAFGEEGATSISWIVMFGTLGISVIVLPIASFDVGLALAFQLSTVVIPSCKFLLEFSDPNVRAIAGALLLYFGLMGMLVMALHRAEVALLQSYEKLTEQEGKLKVAHCNLEQTHGLVRAMLESINQAFLLFNKQGLCTSIPSEKSKKLLNVDPTSRHLSEIVPHETENRANLQAWIEMLFLDRFEFDELASHAPSRAQIDSTGSTLKLKYHPMRDEAGKMNSLIFTAIDITQEIQAEQAAKTEHERAEMILRILDAKASFQPFLQEFQRVIHSLTSWDGQDLATLRRELHTMKGGAMIFGAGSLAQAVYATELALISHGDLPRLKELVRAKGSELLQQFTAWQRDNMVLFTQLGVFAGQSVEITQKRIEEAKRAYQVDREAKDLFDKVLSHLLSNDLGELLSEFEAHVLSTASKLGKKVSFQIEPLAGPVLMPAGSYRDVLRSFIHLFNNAVDHGLETPDERVAAGKGPMGKITVRYGRATVNGQSRIRILIEDDGAGINVAKIRYSLLERGDADASKMGDLEIAMCIFNNGLSTRDSVNELSGQGVGMGSVKAAIVEAHGEIQVVRTGTSGTLFQILLPDIASPSAILLSAAAA